MTRTINESKANDNHTHEWVVFSTALATRCLMVQCVECGLNGTVDDPTTDEWSDAFHAPATPYRWQDGSRVRVRQVGPFQVIRATKDRKCECYARFGLLEPSQYECVPAEILKPPVSLTDDEREEFERLAELVTNNDLCSAVFPQFVEEYQQHTGQQPTAALREVARRIEKSDGMTLHCSPSVVARVLREWANQGPPANVTIQKRPCAAPGANASMIPVAPDAFVIYDNNEAPANSKDHLREEEEERPAREYPDHVLSANARAIYRNFMIEPVYKDGEETGEYRVCRRWPDPCWHWRTNIRWEAVLNSKEEAREWGLRHTEGW